MFWKRDHRVIEVEMFDAQTSTLLSRMKLSVDRLPESFEAQTTMHVKERDYSVVKAVPMTAAEFRRSGKLKLLLRQANIQSVDPRELLFSLPTICDAVAPIEPGSTKLNKTVIELHEDDWRQREFVSLSHQNEIDRHLSEIRRIYEQQRVGSGFKKIHVREGLTEPLGATPPSIAEITEAADIGATMLDGIAYDDIAGIVDSGIAIRLLSGIELYGICNDRRLSVLCVGSTQASNAPLEPAIAPLVALTKRHELCLVDWCRAEQILPDDLLAYFKSRR